MTTRENQLLGNLLDALDRLFDRRSSVIDVWALLFATTEALRGTPHQSELEKRAETLLVIVRSGDVRSVDTQEAQRDRALAETDGLRHYLARHLPVE